MQQLLEPDGKLIFSACAPFRDSARRAGFSATRPVRSTIGAARARLLHDASGDPVTI
jgi:hypothetical protein